MPLTRWIISSRSSQSQPAADAIVNTLYFNVSGSVDEPDYTSLGNDLFALWEQKPWAAGKFLDVRGYSMDDPEPRPQKYIKRATAAGSNTASGPGQVALCLSYYADRNLPRQRGRLYLGPWTVAGPQASDTNTISVIGLATSLAALGGLNVDWSLWSPTTQQHARINHAWCDNSWDIIRSRKLPATSARRTWDGNG